VKTETTQLVPVKGTSILIRGDLEGAKQWLDRAAMMERGKLFCQVMAGFEIAVLWKQAGIKNGGDHCSADAKAVSQNGKVLSREDILEALKLSNTQAYRIMEMSVACATRLRKLPALKGFDPSTPITALPPTQQDALATAVQKLTDGHTQREFGESIGLWKKPQGSGATGRKPGEGGRKKLSLSEQAELLKLQAAEDWKALEKGHTAYRHKFCALTDLNVTAQIAVLERALTARKAWLKQPLNARDPKAIEALF